MIEQSILNSWKSVYEIKNKNEGLKPVWFDKNQELKIMTKQEQEELETVLKEIGG